MKHMNRYMGALVLLLAAICQGAEEVEKGQEITFYIKNLLKVPIHGGIYKTTAGGGIIDLQNAQYYTIAEGECIPISIHKPSTEKKRATEYHRIIFSNDKLDLFVRLSRNKGSETVTSKLIPQKNLLINIFSPDAKNEECYTVGGTPKKPKISRRPNCNEQQCTSVKSLAVGLPIAKLGEDPSTSSSSPAPAGAQTFSERAAQLEQREKKRYEESWLGKMEARAKKALRGKKTTAVE